MELNKTNIISCGHTGKVTQFNYNQAIFKDLLSLIQYVKREQAEEIKDWIAESLKKEFANGNLKHNFKKELVSNKKFIHSLFESYEFK